MKDDLSQALTAHKRAFLTSQIRLLSTPLTSPLIATGSTASQPGGALSLPSTALTALTTATSKKLTSHARLHFGIESQSHIVEQIDSLYWRDVLGQGKGGLPSIKAETCIKRSVDLVGPTGDVRETPGRWEDVVIARQSGNARPAKRRKAGTFDADRRDSDLRIDSGRRTEDDVSDLSSQTSDEDDGEDPDEEQEQVTQALAYTNLRTQLLAQLERRDQLHQKIAQMKELQRLLEPFENPQVNVQPNLATKDNKELEQELSRMRVLMARVGAGLQRQRGRDVTGGGSGGEVSTDAPVVRSTGNRIDELLRL